MTKNNCIWHDKLTCGSLASSFPSTAIWGSRSIFVTGSAMTPATATRERTKQRCMAGANNFISFGDSGRDYSCWENWDLKRFLTLLWIRRERGRKRKMLAISSERIPNRSLYVQNALLFGLGMTTTSCLIILILGPNRDIGRRRGEGGNYVMV